MTKSGLKSNEFEAIIDGKKTVLHALTNANGMEVCVCNYGGTIVSVMTPDRNGKFANVVLGYQNIDQMVNGPEPTLGVAVGRYGNRIAQAQFSLGGQVYHVTPSQAPHCLHGGDKGFEKQVWDVKEVTPQSITLTYLSKDGEEGFPGNLSCEMTYTLTDDNAIRIDYSATTDKLTLCNLTNHSYFNLAGIEAGKPASLITDHLLTMCCDQYIPVDPTCIPLGDRATVVGTPFDFRTPHLIGERIEADDQQIRNGAGYDHCFCINGYDGKNLQLASIAEYPATGRVLKTYTTEPGIQLYTGNWLSNFEGIGGSTFPRRCGFCLESQKHPDSPNQPKFEQATLAPGEVYKTTTVYAFSVK